MTCDLLTIRRVHNGASLEITCPARAHLLREALNCLRDDAYGAAKAQSDSCTTAELPPPLSAEAAMHPVYLRAFRTLDAWYGGWYRTTYPVDQAIFIDARTKQRQVSNRLDQRRWKILRRAVFSDVRTSNVQAAILHLVTSLPAEDQSQIFEQLSQDLPPVPVLTLTSASAKGHSRLEVTLFGTNVCTDEPNSPRT